MKIYSITGAILVTILSVASCSSDETLDYRQEDSSNSVEHRIKDYTESLWNSLNTSDNPSRANKEYNLLEKINYVESLTDEEFVQWSNKVEEACQNNKYEDMASKLGTVLSPAEVKAYYDFAISYANSKNNDAKQKLIESINDKPTVAQDLYIVVVKAIDAVLTVEYEPIQIHFSAYGECEMALVTYIACEIADDAVKLFLEGDDPFMDIHLACDTADQINHAIADYHNCKHK